MNLINMNKQENFYNGAIKDISNNKYFFYKISHTEYKVLLQDIIYFESQGRQVKMVTIKGESIFYDTLNSILKRVNSEKFVRIHKGFIVNYNYVIAFSSKQVELLNHKILPIGVSKQKEVKQAKTKWESI